MTMLVTMSAPTARAYAPVVPRSLARAALAGAPGATDAARLLAAQAAAAVDAHLAAEEADPEAYAMAHAWFAPSAGADQASFGDAPWVLSRAHDELGDAFRRGDPAAIVRATAALAVAAGDLADPFRTAGPARAGVPGARARFCDLVADADVPADDASSIVAGGARDARTAGLELAASSAAARDSAEMLFVAGRDAELAALRRERIAAAMCVMAELVASARASAATTASASDAKSSVFVLPNPARAHALLGFRAAGAGMARVLIVAADGRRVASFESTIVAPGAVTLSLDAALPAALAPGAYFARVTAPGVNGVARFVRISP